MFGSLTTWIIAGLIALNVGSYTVSKVRHKWQLAETAATVRADEAAKQTAVCVDKIAKIEAYNRDYTEGQVAAGAEAASEVLPITVEDRERRCCASALCRDRDKLRCERFE